jgi:hypothetical protein
MAEDEIRLSPEHGVNPAVPLCFYCLRPKGEDDLAGRLKGDAEAPHNAVFDRVPCDECKEWMKAGVILIATRDGEPDAEQNPHRTGGWVVLTDDAVRRLMTPPELAEEALKRRVAFVPDAAWEKMGLKRPPEGFYA